jgi:hypothetical protein
MVCQLKRSERSLLLNIPDSGLILRLSTSGFMGCVGRNVQIVQSYNCVPCHVDGAGEELEGAGQRWDEGDSFKGDGTKDINESRRFRQRNGRCG